MLKAKLLYKAFRYMQSKYQGQICLGAPMEAQQNFLQEVMSRQASTLYGREYQFDKKYVRYH